MSELDPLQLVLDPSAVDACHDHPKADCSNAFILAVIGRDSSGDSPLDSPRHSGV